MHVLPKKKVVTRYAKNPVITNEMMPFSCRGVYNSSAVKHGGRYIMVLRAEGYNLLDSFWIAESLNGYDGWKIGKMIPLPETDEYKKYGDNQYDPRITKIGEIYYITFCVHGKHEARMGMMSTKDFKTFRWEHFLTGAGFRNTVLFPEKVGGLYAALERPNTTGEIWLTRSPDLKYWGGQEHILKAPFSVWSTGKIGPCGTPIRTEQGWLVIFHSVQIICDHEYIYHTGIMLLDLENPAKLIRVSNEPIMTPEEPYELTGHAPNVVFASSQIVEEDGSVKIYYGAADRYQCVADSTLELLLEAALER